MFSHGKVMAVIDTVFAIWEHCQHQIQHHCHRKMWTNWCA